MKAGDIVVAYLPSGETHARYVRPTNNRRGHVVDIGGAIVTAFAARPLAKAVQP